MSFRDIHETRGQFNLRLHTRQCLKNTQKVSFEHLRPWSNWRLHVIFGMKIQIIFFKNKMRLLGVIFTHCALPIMYNLLDQKQ